VYTLSNKQKQTFMSKKHAQKRLVSPAQEAKILFAKLWSDLEFRLGTLAH
jgi:hypothetical protein